MIDFLNRFHFDFPFKRLPGGTRELPGTVKDGSVSHRFLSVSLEP